MKKIFISLFALFIFISCDNKESYMQDFSQFIQEVEDNADNYSEKPEFGIRLCHKVYGVTRYDTSSLHKCEWLSIVCKK